MAGAGRRRWGDAGGETLCVDQLLNAIYSDFEAIAKRGQSDFKAGSFTTTSITASSVADPIPPNTQDFRHRASSHHVCCFETRFSDLK